MVVLAAAQAALAQESGRLLRHAQVLCDHVLSKDGLAAELERVDAECILRARCLHLSEEVAARAAEHPRVVVEARGVLIAHIEQQLGVEHAPPAAHVPIAEPKIVGQVPRARQRRVEKG
eukprot:1138961-Prymnesium_polylepis.1